MNYYALTIQQTSGNITEWNYNKALDRLETKYDCKIFPRYFETGKVMKRLHVHALVTQDSSKPKITVMDSQKNHNIDFAECQSKQAWLNYSSKDQDLAQKKKIGGRLRGLE